MNQTTKQPNQKRNGSIFFDLDGTLAKYFGWKGHTQIGEPVQPILSLIKQYLEEGWEVRIFTARVYPLNACIPPDFHVESLFNRPNLTDSHIQAIEAVISIREWCKLHIGQVLAVTNIKDYTMVMTYDDRCCQVVINTGELVGGNPKVEAH